MNSYFTFFILFHYLLINTKSAPSIPVLDFSVETSQLSNEIDNALKMYGFFVAINTNISNDDVKNYFDGASNLFDLPLNSKLDVKTQKNSLNFLRGYIGFGDESGLIDSYFEPKEGFSYGNHRNRNVDSRKDILTAENRWPNLLSLESKQSLESIFTKTVVLAKRIVFLLSSLIDNDYLRKSGFLPSNQTFYDITNNGDEISLMRLFHYFPRSHDLIQKMMNQKGPNNVDISLGSSPHTDWGLLTLILQDEIGGLQCWYENQWIDVPYVENSIIVNGGDYLSILSNFKYKSPIHRVLTHPENERKSFVLFYYPNSDSVIPEYLQEDLKFANKGDRNDVIETDKMQESGRLVKEEGEIEIKFNTLLDGHNTESNLKPSSFGEYIVQKWMGVSH